MIDEEVPRRKGRPWQDVPPAERRPRVMRPRFDSLTSTVPPGAHDGGGRGRSRRDQLNRCGELPHRQAARARSPPAALRATSDRQPATIARSPLELRSAPARINRAGAPRGAGVGSVAAPIRRRSALLVALRVGRYRLPASPHGNPGVRKEEERNAGRGGKAPRESSLNPTRNRERSRANQRRAGW
jgi:hypothetical protein